nr:hypothetical protein CFP56_40293 [Quercus suber]
MGNQFAIGFYGLMAGDKSIVLPQTIWEALSFVLMKGRMVALVLTIQNNTARKAEGENGSRKAEGLTVEIDRRSIYEVEEEMQQ